MKGILLDENNDLRINVKRNAQGKITGGLVIGSRKMQDAYLVLNMNQGDLKQDPLAGANLLRMIRSRASNEKIRKTIEIALRRVGVRYYEIKAQIELLINKIRI